MLLIIYGFFIFIIAGIIGTAVIILHNLKDEYKKEGSCHNKTLVAFMIVLMIVIGGLFAGLVGLFYSSIDLVRPAFFIVAIIGLISGICDMALISFSGFIEDRK